MGKYDDQLDRLLARGRLTPDELDQVLDRAVKGAANDEPLAKPTPRSFWRWALVPALSFGVVASLFLVIAHPFSTDEFRSRGGGTETSIAAECGTPCVTGSPIVFRVGAHRDPGYLAAFATSGSRRVWYYPTAETPSPLLPPSQEDTLSPHAAQIGDEQAPGRYVVHTYLLSEPLPREAVAELKESDPRVLGHAQTPLEIVEKK